MIGDIKSALLDVMRSMLVEFKRANGWSEYGGAEGIATEGEGPAEVGPTDLGQSPAGAGLTAVRETILHYIGLQNFGGTGRGEAAVPVEGGSERGQPDQRARAREMGIYPNGELDGGFGLPSSRLPHKHPPTFNGQKEHFIP